MEVILSVAFGQQTDFQVKEDETITKEAKDWFRAKPVRLFIGLLIRVLMHYPPKVGSSQWCK